MRKVSKKQELHSFTELVISPLPGEDNESLEHLLNLSLSVGFWSLTPMTSLPISAWVLIYAWDLLADIVEPFRAAVIIETCKASLLRSNGRVTVTLIP